MELFNRPLFNLGLGILGARNVGGNPGQALMQGVNYMQVQDEYRRQREAEEAAMQAAMAQQQRQQALIGQMPGQLQQVLGAYPGLAEDFFKNQLMPETPEQTALMRNLAAAGLQPGTPEYTKAIMDSLSKSNVTVNTGTPRMPTSEEIRADDMKARAKDARTFNSDMIKQGFEGNANILNYDRMLKLLETVETGFGQETLLKARQIGAALGMDIDISNISSQEQLQTLIGDEIMSRVSQTKGAVSEKEMELFRQYSPSLSKTPEGNRKIIQFKKAKAKRDIEVAKLIRSLRREGKTSVEIEEEVFNYVAKNDLSNLLYDKQLSGAGGVPANLQNMAIEEMRRRGMR